MKDSISTRKHLLGLVGSLYDQFENGIVPQISIPTRTKNNIEYDPNDKVWVYGKQKSVRSVKTVRGAKSLLKASYLVGLLIDEHLKHDRGSTLREIYYISENWDMAKFGEQSESDRLVEDLEILTELQREDFHVRPEEDGATIFGPLEIKESTRRGERRIHCQEDVGEAGYQIPFIVMHPTIDFLNFH